MVKEILREATLEGGPVDGETVNVDLSQCEEGGEYFRVFKKNKSPIKDIYIVYVFGGWVNKRRAKFRFKGYDYVGRDGPSSC